MANHDILQKIVLTWGLRTPKEWCPNLSINLITRVELEKVRVEQKDLGDPSPKGRCAC